MSATGSLLLAFAAVTAAAQEMPSLAPIVERALPSVVNISVNGSVTVSSPFGEDELFRRFFQLPPEGRRQIQSAGSGVIVDAEQGYILTNHHVLENAEEIRVTLYDNRSMEARIVGSDEGSDLAVLQVEATGLEEMPLGNSDELRVGDYVVAIGNPFGLSHTVTSGIVSGLGRTNINPQGYEDFIQTDASINPGNSGGALINLRGELVGINTAIFSRFGGNIGIGFAIPVNMARAIMEQLITYGEVSRGLLGVSINNLTPEIAETYGLRDTSGAIVMAVTPGSAAEQAGIQVDDVIVSVNGQRVRDAGALRNAIGLLRPGDRVTVGLIRDGREQTVSAVLGALTAATTTAAEPEPAPTPRPGLDPAFDGATLVTNDESRQDFNGVPGVLVTSVRPGSPAAERGLRAGDVIVEVNRQRVRTLEEASRTMQNARAVILKVRRGNRDQLILMR
ncbi:MAG TPA: DegQ family serine endoprotease [Gammaproteobacteria bacterium]